jgi:tryptophanyl-tRNA synthetase
VRIFSGIQPTGRKHLGNYVGAIRGWVEAQDRGEGIYCMVDLHAITVPYDPVELRSYVLDTTAILMAAGLDPERCILFRQSDVREHTELAWLLGSVTAHGDLNRMTQFKDKSARHRELVSAGIFFYPVLQAADILLYDADLVPVGQDQKQHLEITRDIAERFNRVYGGDHEVFRLPKPYILENTAVVPGLDGRKMSKSYNNTIEIFDEPAAIRKKVKRIVTDSTPVEAPKDPEKCSLFSLFRLFAPADELTEVERRYREGGIGYGEMKNRLAEAIIERFAAARQQRADWVAHPERVAEVRAAAAARARTAARVVLDRARAACGVG